MNCVIVGLNCISQVRITYKIGVYLFHAHSTALNCHALHNMRVTRTDVMYVPMYVSIAADISKDKVCQMELTTEAAAQFEFAVDTQVCLPLSCYLNILTSVDLSL
jgi:hypothetical protein